MNRIHPLLPLIRLLGLLALVVAGRAAAPAEPADTGARDVLVYEDGDRVQGRLVEHKDGVLVFRSDRFGVLRLPDDMAVVIVAEPTVHAAAPLAAEVTPPGEVAPGSTPAPAEAGPATPGPAAPAALQPRSVWERMSLAGLTARLHEFFGPWHGRLAFSTEVVSDNANRNNVSLEGRLSRKWDANEIQLNGRYDYSKTNDISTTDVLKADGLWRREFGRSSFVQYRPVFEWNRANVKAKIPTDYVLLQQEIGVGVSLVATPARKLRVGMSENLFDVWNTTPPASHNSRTSESAFIETEQRLPWRMTLTDRGVYYYSIASGGSGWENRLELSKKFTESLSTAIRHETRQGSPDGTAQDYTRLKLLFGLDF